MIFNHMRPPPLHNYFNLLQDNKTIKEVLGMKLEKLHIEGMHCGHCAAMVKKSLEIVDGVDFCDVGAGEATVRYDEEKATHEDLVRAITRFGYKVSD
jgi:copper chaperone CopZ